MNGVEYLDDYQNAVLAELKNIPWAMTVGVYPELPADFETPALFLDVSQWSRADADIGGNLTVDLRCMLYVVRHMEASGDVDDSAVGVTETRVRNAALKMADWVHGRQFGYGTAPATFEHAEPMVWQKGEDTRPDHVIWGVEYAQLLAVGKDAFDEPDAAPLTTFWLGVFPEVGAGHQDDYLPIPPPEEG